MSDVLPYDPPDRCRDCGRGYGDHGPGCPWRAPSPLVVALPPPVALSWRVVCPDCGAFEDAAHASTCARATPQRCYHCVVARVPPPRVGTMPRCDRCRVIDVAIRERGAG